MTLKSKPTSTESTYRWGKVVTIMKRRKLILMDYTSEGVDETKEVMLPDKPFLFSLN